MKGYTAILLLILSDTFAFLTGWGLRGAAPRPAPIRVGVVTGSKPATERSDASIEHYVYPVSGRAWQESHIPEIAKDCPMCHGEGPFEPNERPVRYHQKRLPGFPEPRTGP